VIPTLPNPSVWFHLAAFVPLSVADEKALGLAIQTGDEAARERFINHNLRLIVSIAKKYMGYGIDMEDLCSEGYFGLIRALDKFDWQRGCRFSTYATWWIRQAVQRHVFNQRAIIRIPVHVTESGISYGARASSLRGQLGREPTDTEMGDAMGLPADQWAILSHRVRNAYHIQPESLDVSPLEGTGDDGALPLRDLLSDDTPSVEDQIVQEELHHDLMALLASLPLRTRQVIAARAKGQSLSTCSRALGVTRERCRQLEEDGLARLRGLPETRQMAERWGFRMLGTGAMSRVPGAGPQRRVPVGCCPMPPATNGARHRGSPTPQ
jgi:RNA polymerase primary sigma factor